MSTRTKIFLVFSLILATYILFSATYWIKSTESQGQSIQDLEALHADFNAYYERIYGKVEDNIELPDSIGLVQSMKYFSGEVKDDTPKPEKAKKLIKKPKAPKTVKKFINQKNNPFELLGVYEDTSSFVLDPHYDEVHFGIENNNDYCKFVDMVNLRGPQHLYGPKGYAFTDFGKNSLVHSAISNFSQNFISKSDIESYIQNYKVTKKGTALSPLITNFFTSFERFYNYHKIGQNFLCESQMSNHIPGQEQLVRKDFFIDNFRQYSKEYLKRPECFNQNTFVPHTFRLFKKEECLAFFKIIGSEKYQNSTKENPVQYVVKIDEGTYKWENLHLLDDEKTLMMKHLYQNGEKCGLMKKAILVQKYITNPLLLDRNNRFDLRAYMLVASTNPLTVFYRDGYLKVSSRSFNKSDDNVKQLPNRNLAAEQKEESQFWTFEKLENYLLESKKIKDKKWLDEYLRPALKKAFIHTIRMTSSKFWKKSNVYELFEMEFVLDENLQLWFIESKPTPSFGGSQPKFIEKMLSDLFEIEYAFYRSRMVRVMELMRKIQQDSGKNDKKILQKWRTMYKDASVNRLEPQFIPMISKTNEWKLIMTERFKGVKAYLGHMNEKCL